MESSLHAAALSAGSPSLGLPRQLLRPGRQRLGLGLLEAEGGLGRDEQGRVAVGWRSRPLVAALVEGVVDPGEGAVPRVLAQRAQLPVGGAEAGGAVEGQEGQLGQPEERGEASRWPGPPSRSPRRGRSARRAGCSRSPAASEMQWTMPSISSKRATVAVGRLVEAEEADHPVDVDGEHRLAGIGAA